MHNFECFAAQSNFTALLINSTSLKNNNMGALLAAVGKSFELSNAAYWQPQCEESRALEGSWRCEGKGSVAPCAPFSRLGTPGKPVTGVPGGDGVSHSLGEQLSLEALQQSEASNKVYTQKQRIDLKSTALRGQIKQQNEIWQSNTIHVSREPIHPIATPRVLREASMWDMHWRGWGGVLQWGEGRGGQGEPPNQASKG